MKLNLDILKQMASCRRWRKIDRGKVWEPWFAWRPVKIAEGDWRWLEVVVRKLDLSADALICNPDDLVHTLRRARFIYLERGD